MGILRTDRVSGLGGANAITGSTFFAGTASTGNYLRIDTGGTEDFTFGTGDFTIEFWINSQGSGFQQHPYDGRGTTNTNRLLIYIDTNNTVYYFGNGGARIQASSALPIDEWVHFALVRASGSTKMYFNGTQTGSTYSDTIDFLAPAQGHLFIGSNGGTDGINPTGGGYLNGFLSNYRIVKGTAVYTANFTPPNTRLTAIDGTVLLTCTSSGNVSKTEGGNDVQPSAKNSNSTPPVASRFTPNSPVGFSTTTDVGTQFGSTFDGVTTFDSQAYMVVPGGNTRERNRGRAIMAGGMMYPTIAGEEIDMLEIQSGGLTQDFGDLTVARSQSAPMSSSTRAVIGGGMDGGTRKNEIDFVTIASTGNAIDFGDVSEAISYLGGVSNQTRGLILGGNGPSSPSNTNQIEFISIATAGNSADFGQLTRIGYGFAGSGSPTRGLIFGGYVAPAVSDTIDFVTIASAGNATDFGNTTVARASGASCSSSTRAIFGGGYTPSPTPSTELNVIDYVTIASTGNAIDFGDLSVVGSYLGATSNGTRGIFGSRMTNQPYTGDPTIDTVIIASTGNAVNWGDQERMDSGPHDGQPIVRRSSTTMSDSHGGLS